MTCINISGIKHQPRFCQEYVSFRIHSNLNRNTLISFYFHHKSLSASIWQDRPKHYHQKADNELPKITNENSINHSLPPKGSMKIYKFHFYENPQINVKNILPIVKKASLLQLGFRVMMPGL